MYLIDRKQEYFGYCIYVDVLKANSSLIAAALKYCHWYS